MNMPMAMLLTDGYKTGHPMQYPDDLDFIYATWTPRCTRIPGINDVGTVGMQLFFKHYLIDYFNENFFKLPKAFVLREYNRVLVNYRGKDYLPVEQLEKLHDLGYLPLKFMAVPEGSTVKVRTPIMAWFNTVKGFGWVVNYIETLLSDELWYPMTNCTQAIGFKRLLRHFADLTVGPDYDIDGQVKIPNYNNLNSVVGFQGHDFSMRGMCGWWAAAVSSIGHLSAFTGTETIPSLWLIDKYYNGNIENEFVAGTIPATEHSVMCSYGKENEKQCFEELFKIYKTGAVSVVSDTWDFWRNITETIPSLKGMLMSRDGKLVVRPDSGDPVKIVSGDPEAREECVRKGAIECLYDTFGGHLSNKGYKILDPHIGLIYGDAITWTRCKEICQNLMNKGIASTNMVFGIGSYTYQYITRDTFGFAVKSTLCSRGGKEMALFKDPKTDTGVKKSQKGAVVVFADGTYKDGFTLSGSLNHPDNVMKPVFEDGKLLKDYTFAEIRKNIDQSNFTIDL